ncbi:MAG: ABC transporter [Spirochaetaceae bacterium 4572_7]|nr:MAG: ABC transporter [Spirochaetaceae bacterium 4572_7]
MFKMIKYIKPYTLPLILAIGLLYLQVDMNLTLPDYMSKIVNIGIQQGGVTDVLPEIIRKSEFDTLLLLMDDKSKDSIKSLYSTNQTDINNIYNKIDLFEVYYLDKSKLISEDVKTDLAKSMITLSGIKKMKISINSETPKKQLEMIKNKAKEKIRDLNGNFIIQGGIAAVRGEYEILGANMIAIQNSYIIKYGLLMLLMTLISVLAAISVGFIAAKTAAGSAKNIRGDLFRKIESFSSSEFDKFSTASLITRSTNDITQIQTLVFMTIRMVIYAPLLGVGGFIRAMSKAPSMGWLIGIAVLCLLVLIAIVIKIAIPKFTIVQTLVDRLNLVARENLSGLLVVRAFNRELFEEKRFDVANKDVTKVNLFVGRTMVVMMPLIMLIMNSLIVAIIWVGSNNIGAGNMQVGDMMAFMQYAMQIVMAFMMLSMFFIYLPKASVSAKRIAEVLSTEPSIVDSINSTNFPTPLKCSLEFDDVSFKYPGGEVNAISNISFKAEPGTTTAFIGATGSGKSTVATLIPRFYDVTSGVININGLDIRDLKQQELRKALGIVLQKNILFRGTIESNLKYGKMDATDDDLFQILKIAQAKDFVESKKDGLESEISQNGTNVSGGQRQRLAITRALIKDAPILIFDDSFSALDFKTDLELRTALKNSSKEKTILIIAQRVATIMDADQIIVMDDGAIIAKGSHNELLKTCEAYREIAISQLGQKVSL